MIHDSVKGHKIGNHNIGNRIKTLRVAQFRTLQDIALASELSRSMISKIENNKTAPSVSALVKIAKVPGTNISSLLEGDGWGNAILTTKQKAEHNITATEKGYYIHPFCSQCHQKKLQPFLFAGKRNEVKQHELSCKGEEFVFILEGKLKMQIGEIEYLLEEGDSLYFNSSQRHSIMPLSDEVIYLDIFADSMPV